MTKRFEARRVSDPVHGTIGLSELEILVINTPPFQRLRHVKQLGLAHYVFPGADYSRLAHSIGACHITGRIFTSLSNNGAALTEDDLQLYRLAALLHDIGHYPFSHTMETAISNYYSETLLEPPGTAASTDVTMSDATPTDVMTTESGGQPSESVPAEAPASTSPRAFKHEQVSREIVLNDPELSHVLEGYDREHLAAIFTREEPMPFANLVSSDLDADRIDYLVRTAHHSGLPYGDIDLDYIISQMRLDENRKVSLTSKAVRAADHFLLSRYFDYQQVSYHKTVASLELLLEDVLRSMLKGGAIQASSDWIRAAVRGRTWSEFDDAYVFQKMRETVVTTRDDILKQKLVALLTRRAPTLICEREYVGGRGGAHKKGFRLLRRAVKLRRAEWARSAGIDETYFYIWERAITLTKIGASVPVTAMIEHDDEDEEALEQAIRILDGTSSKRIQELPHSLMSILADHALYALRVYVLLPGTTSDERKAQRLRIAEAIKDDLPEADWK